MTMRSSETQHFPSLINLGHHGAKARQQNVAVGLTDPGTLVVIFVAFIVGSLNFSLISTIASSLLGISAPAAEVQYSHNATASVKVVGDWMKSVNGRQFGAYQRIPFASPPVGDLRFKSPIEPVFSSANTVIENDGVNTDVPICAQIPGYDETENRGVEDCLYLNVYSPATEGGDLLPVIVFIHGGSLNSGTGVYGAFGPLLMMNKDVVLVTLNYRLGALGFISLGTDQVPGNAGFLDQTMALTWVQKHIMNFGGDKDKVTLMGESAGGFCVGYHMISPRSKNLFQRAVILSGSPLSQVVLGRFSTGPEAIALASSFAADLQCNQGDLDCLQNVSVDSLVNKGRDIAWSGNLDADFTSEPFFTTDVVTSFLTTDFGDLEVLIGDNKDEGLHYSTFFPDQQIEITGVNWAFTCPALLFSGAQSPAIDFACSAISSFYNVSDGLSREEFTKIASDAVFKFGTFQLATLLPARSVKTYQYQLTHQGQYHYLDGVANTFGLDGVSHADAYFYLFNPAVGRSVTLNPADQEISELMLTAWTNFAATGQPFNNESSLTWNPIQEDIYQYFNIRSSDSGMDLEAEYIARMQFWAALTSGRKRRNRVAANNLLKMDRYSDNLMFQLNRHNQI